MKTALSEIEKRKKIWQEAFDKYSEMTAKCHILHGQCEEKEKQVALDLGIPDLNWSDHENILESIWKPHTDFLESPEWKEVSGTMSFGPTYDLYNEDIENMDYEFPWGTKLSESGAMIKAIKKYKLHKTYMPGGHSNPCELLGFSFDYGDYYYRLRDLLDDKIIYETMVSFLDDCIVSSNDVYAWSSSPIWITKWDEVLYKNKKYTRKKRED